MIRVHVVKHRTFIVDSIIHCLIVYIYSCRCRLMQTRTETTLLVIVLERTITVEGRDEARTLRPPTKCLPAPKRLLLAGGVR